MSITKRHVYNLFGWILSLIAMAYFFGAVSDYYSSISDFQWNMLKVTVMLVSIGIFVVTSIISGLAWSLLLKDQNISIKHSYIQEIFLLSQVGKYIPGNVAHHIGRVYLAKQYKIPVINSINSMLIETVWIIAIGASLAVFALINMVDIEIFEKYVHLDIYLLMMMAFCALLIPWITIFIANNYLPTLVIRVSGGSKLPMPKLSTAIFVSMLYLSVFIFMGLVIKLQFTYLFDVASNSIFLFACIFSISWIAGFLVPGAPAGLGIRETLLILMLSPLYGPTAAVSLTVFLRVTTVIGDGVAFVIGTVLKIIVNKRQMLDCNE